MSTSSIRTLEQNRAEQAWNDVQKVVNDNRDPKAYKSLVKSAPAFILTNGLLQTLAFYQSKRNSNAHKYLLDHLSGWVLKQLQLGPEANALSTTSGDNKLAQLLRSGNSSRLRLATQESLAYLQWLRRFADAQIEGEEQK